MTDTMIAKSAALARLSGTPIVETIGLIVSLPVTFSLLGKTAFEMGRPGFDPASIWPLVTLVWIIVCAIFSVILIYRLRGREQRMKTLMMAVMNKSRAGRTILDAGGNPIFYNPAIEALAGETPGRTGLAGLFATPAASAMAFEDMYQRSLLSETATQDLEADGRWFNIIASPLEEIPGLVQWRVSDITKRHVLEEERRIERAKYIDFLDNAPGGFFSVGASGQFLFANRVFAEWIGVPVDDLLSGDYRLHQFLDKPPEGEAYDVVDGGGIVQHGEIVLRTLSGQLFPATIAQTVVDDRDHGLRTRAVVRDLLQERKWQAALAQSQRRFQRFFEDAPIGIALIDDHGAVIECNRMMAEMIDHPVDETIGLTLSHLLAGPDCARIEAILKKEGPVPDHPWEVKLGGKRDVVAQLYMRRLPEPEPPENGLILHFIDLTDQKNLERQFGQSQKMQAVGQLAGGIAHDFNNLLTAMIGFCDLLLLRHKPGDSSFGDIMQIKQNANRAANLVRQLLAFSRQQTLQPRVLDVSDALTELLHLLRRLIGENIELKMIHGRDLGLVKVDQGQFEQVLINLCVNARDAMQRGGKLTIKTANRKSRTTTQLVGEEMPPGEWVVISVTDTGVGITDDVLPRIFEPFFSTKEVGSGTGLGLSTVYGIVRQTGGYVHVESTPGEGTTFYIYLPRHAEVENAEPVQEIVHEKQGGDLTGAGQILLVEDEDAVRIFSARALRNKGYQVREANSGEAALHLLANTEEPIDLLITDVIMPQMDGPTLVEEVKKNQPELKVIFISGYTEDRVRSQFASTEEIHFLPKPFTLKQLASKVKDVMFSEK